MSGNHDRNDPGPAGDDDAVTRAWRQASDEQPPPALDAAIIATARKSVQEEGAGVKTHGASPRVRNRWMRWQPLAAAATVAGLAFMLVQLLPRERDVAPPLRVEAPPLRIEARPSASIPAPIPDTTEEKSSSAPAIGGAPVPAATGMPPRDRSAEGAAASPTADVAASIRDAEADQPRRVMTEAAREATSAEVAAPDFQRSPDRAAAPSAMVSAADWAARIEALHASGDAAAAAQALREFRAVDPDADAQLPESLREWARTVE